MGYAEEAAEILGWLATFFGLTGFFSVALSVAMWILNALGLYTIANRRGIKHPWMAWIPVTDLWILGSISDQYYYVSKGKVKNRRKWMIAMSIFAAVMGLAFMVTYAVAIGQMIVEVISAAADMSANVAPDLGDMEQFMEKAVGPIALLSVLMNAVALWQKILQYMSYYGLFSSCDPHNKTVFTVIAILIPVTLPFFVFACRNKDLGMPPRKDAPAPQSVEPAAIPAPVKAEAEEDPVNVNNVEE